MGGEEDKEPTRTPRYVLYSWYNHVKNGGDPAALRKKAADLSPEEKRVYISHILASRAVHGTNQRILPIHDGVSVEGLIVGHFYTMYNAGLFDNGNKSIDMSEAEQIDLTQEEHNLTEILFNVYIGKFSKDNLANINPHTKHWHMCLIMGGYDKTNFYDPAHAATRYPEIIMGHVKNLTDNHVLPGAFEQLESLRKRAYDTEKSLVDKVRDQAQLIEDEEARNAFKDRHLLNFDKDYWNRYEEVTGLAELLQNPETKKEFIEERLAPLRDQALHMPPYQPRWVIPKEEPKVAAPPKATPVPLSA